MKDLYIGIDPGEHNGLALYDNDNGLRLFTMKYWELIDFITGTIVPLYKKEATIIPHFIVENPNLNGFIYQQKITQHNKAQAFRIAQNVGMNKCDARRIIELIQRHDMPLEEVRPKSGSAKWTDAQLEQIYGQKIRCSQHARDAAKLIAGYWINGRRRS